jgi:ATP-dependent exoDNAse (exonuclease V) alpha subunit
MSSFLNYGDGRLLAHIFTFVGNRKVIFIGDPAQLPPVKNKFSAALDVAYIKTNFKISATSAELKTVLRQDKNSGILFNASRLRFPEIETPVLLRIKASGFNDIKLCYQQSALVREYVELVKTGNFKNAIIITFGNKSVHKFNMMVRQYLFRGKNTATSGEWLMVVFNNYAYDLANGQHVKIISISGATENRANLNFRDVGIEVEEMGQKRLVNCKIIEDLLYRPEPSLSIVHENALMKDFTIRMRNMGINPKDDTYEIKFKSDPYLNALRVKFGYAVTGHKSQGGEWPNVLLQLEYSLGYLDRESVYRWVYTAVTRASKTLYLLKNNLIY